MVERTVMEEAVLQTNKKEGKNSILVSEIFKRDVQYNV